MKQLIGIVIKINLNKTIKILVPFFIHKHLYKNLSIKYYYLLIHDKRNEVCINDLVLFNFYKKSKNKFFIVNKILK